MAKIFGFITLILAFALSTLTINANAMDAQLAQKKANESSQTTSAQNPLEESESSEGDASVSSLYEDLVEHSSFDQLNPYFETDYFISFAPRLEVGVPLADVHRPPKV